MLVLCPEILSHVKGMVIPITQLGICMVFLCGYETHDCKAIRYVIRWNSTEGNPTLFDAAVSKDVFFFRRMTTSTATWITAIVTYLTTGYLGAIPLSAVLCIFSPWIFQGFSNAVWFCRPQNPVVIKP